MAAWERSCGRWTATSAEKWPSSTCSTRSDPRKKLRFIEEAQITGQLEHPNIPPVHELGTDAQEKRLFFSMKMVKGRSLAQVLDDLRQNPKTAEKEWSLGRLAQHLRERLQRAGLRPFPRRGSS